MPSIRPPRWQAVERAECTLHAAALRMPFRLAVEADKVRPMTHNQSDLPDSIAANVAEWTQTNADRAGFAQVLSVIIPGLRASRRLIVVPLPRRAAP